MIGDNIKKYRTLRGLSQLELANLMNVSQKTISSWEIGRTEPNMGMVERLALLLGVRKSDLLGEDGMEQVLTAAEIHLIKAFRKLSREQRIMVMNIVDYAAKESR